MLYFGLCEPWLSLGCQDIVFRQGARGFCVHEPWLSRRCVFRQGGVCVYNYVLFYVSLGCQDVTSLGRGFLCVCSVLCEPWDVSSLGRCVCSFLCEPWLSRCFVFRQGGSVCICVYVLFYVSLGCQDVSSLGNNLSRCFVFRQGGSVCMFCFMWALVVKMFCLWATSCQDVSSLGRGVLCVFSVLCEPWLSRCFVFGQQPVKMFRL